MPNTICDEHGKSLFEYNGRPSEDWKCYKLQPINFPSPSRDYDLVSVPGRDGDIVYDRGRYNSVEIVIECFIDDDFITHFDALRGFLMADTDYHKLVDSLYPDEYRMACVQNVEAKIKTPGGGTVEITMTCKPQRFLKAGDIALPQIAGAGAPVNIIVAEGYAQDIFSSAFISAVGERIVGNERMTVFNLSSYQGKKLALYYSDARIQRGTAVKGGTMSTDPTTGSGTSVIYGDVFNLYSSKVVLNISANYAAYETPNYFEILNADESLAASIFPTSETIMNPTLYSAKPLVKIGYSSYVSGPVCMINGSPVTLDVSPNADINGQTVSISDVTIDCETMDAYTEIPGYPYPYSQNRYVYVPSDITLKPGENEIKVNNKISYVEIIPKWWTL